MSDTDQPVFSWEDLPPLTDAQVRAGALPGESWKPRYQRIPLKGSPPDPVGIEVTSDEPSRLWPRPHRRPRPPTRGRRTGEGRV